MALRTYSGPHDVVAGVGVLISVAKFVDASVEAERFAGLYGQSRAKCSSDPQGSPVFGLVM